MTQKINKKTYITTPIYYLNDKPHIGHFYTSLLADSLIRFNQYIASKEQSSETIFLTGTDEHGQKVQQSAQNKNIETQQYCDEMSKYFKDLVADFNLIFSENNFNNGNNFIRTTDIKHEKFVQKVWQRMIQNNWIYLGTYEGYYAQRDEAFYDKNELIDGKAPTGADVEFKTEECYFFRLSYFRNIFLNCTQNQEFKNREKLKFLPENKINEINSFIKEELTDLPVSRLIKKNNNGDISFDWGIDIPIIQKGDENHVIYVWLDALFNYVSAIGIKLKILKNDEELSDENFDLILEEFQKLNSIHIIGKEILRFHGLYFPAFLYAVRKDNKFIKSFEEENKNIQEKIAKSFINSSFSELIVHGWWTNEGQKISKSLGNIISPYAEIEWLQQEFELTKEIAIDYFKFFLLCSFSCLKDCDYSRNSLIEFINANLVNNIGNLINRNIAMYNKTNLLKEDKKIDYYSIIEDSAADFKENDFLIEGQFYKNLIKKFSKLNEYTDEIKAWELIKSKKTEELYNYFYKIFNDIKKLLNELNIFCPYIAKEFKQIIQNKENRIVTKRLER